MRSIKLLLFTLIIPLFAFTSAHKFYVSVTQIDFINEKQSIQITSRIFIDDLEDLLRQRYDENITLNASKEETSIDSYIEKYLKNKIQIKINGTQKNLIFIGKEYEDDSVLCYLEINNVTSINSFEVINQILFDVFDKQQNIVRTNINAKDKNFILTSQNDKGVLNFN